MRGYGELGERCRVRAAVRNRAARGTARPPRHRCPLPHHRRAGSQGPSQLESSVRIGMGGYAWLMRDDLTAHRERLGVNERGDHGR